MGVCALHSTRDADNRKHCCCCRHLILVVDWVAGGVASKMSRIYIGRLTYNAREKDVERFFRGFGRIKDINLKNGFGFVVGSTLEFFLITYFLFCRSLTTLGMLMMLCTN